MTLILINILILCNLKQTTQRRLNLSSSVETYMVTTAQKNESNKNLANEVAPKCPSISVLVHYKR